MSKFIAVGRYGDKNPKNSIWSLISSFDKFSKSSFFILFLFLIATPLIISQRQIFNTHAAIGNTYYVAQAGSDSNNGASSAPFATIQKAADIVHPGDIVYVEPGIYTTPIYSK